MRCEAIKPIREHAVCKGDWGTVLGQNTDGSYECMFGIAVAITIPANSIELFEDGDEAKQLEKTSQRHLQLEYAY